MENKLIVVEGCDGSGKTTFVKDLKDSITKKSKKLKVKTLSLPNSSCFGYKKIRDILGGKSEISYPTDIVQSLFLANIIECNKRFIDPFFNDSKEDHILILDRYIYSTIIYSAINGGYIFDIIQRYTINKYKESTNIIVDSTIVDFDIISKLYGQLNKFMDLIIFLNPPMDVVLNHAKDRQSNEFNDSTNVVKFSWLAYTELAEFLTGHLRRTIVDVIESPNGMIKPDMDSAPNYVILSEWNRALSEKENYEKYKNTILAKLNL